MTKNQPPLYEVPFYAARTTGLTEKYGAFSPNQLHQEVSNLINENHEWERGIANDELSSSINTMSYCIEEYSSRNNKMNVKNMLEEISSKKKSIQFWKDFSEDPNYGKGFIGFLDNAEKILKDDRIPNKHATLRRLMINSIGSFGVNQSEIAEATKKLDLDEKRSKMTRASREFSYALEIRTDSNYLKGAILVVPLLLGISRFAYAVCKGTWLSIKDSIFNKDSSPGKGVIAVAQTTQPFSPDASPPPTKESIYLRGTRNGGGIKQHNSTI